MDGGQGAHHAQRPAQLLQRQVRALRHQLPHAPLVLGAQLRLSTRETVTRGQVPRAPPLREQLLDEAERNLEALSDLQLRLLPPIAGCHNPFTKIQRYRSHVEPPVHLL